MRRHHRLMALAVVVIALVVMAIRALRAQV